MQTIAQQEPENPNLPNETSYLFLPLTIRPGAVSTPPTSDPSIIDHNSIALFERIPTRYLTTARGLRVLFSDRSVGQNFHEALNCLAAASFGSAPSYCRRHYVSGTSGTVMTYSQADYDAGRVPPVIRFTPSPTLYNRSNWEFVSDDGGWSNLTCNFIQTIAPANMDKNILSYQFSYLNVADNSDIMRFWQNNPNECDIYDLEAFMAQHRDKTFIFWTTSLSRAIGTQVSTDFNNRMRQYARDRNVFLMDFADIESYTHDGRPCYDNRGRNLPAICQDYTTESEGGHLGSVSGARIRTAKAFWVLMARVAGWDGISQ